MILLRASDAITGTLMVLAAAWAFALCFLILGDIVFRALNRPLQGAREIVANAVVIIVFLQVGFAVRSGSMLRADFLVNALPSGLRRAMVVAGYLVGAAFFLFLLKAGITPAMRPYTGGEFDGEGALRAPVWPSRFMILFGSGLAALNYLVLGQGVLEAEADLPAELAQGGRLHRHPEHGVHRLADRRRRRRARRAVPARRGDARHPARRRGGCGWSRSSPRA
jgi:TRAP-type C4-dicarboxylate transport system permease small subunit